MTRRSAWCPCCHQSTAHNFCESCALERARHDGTVAAVVRRLFGSAGLEHFQAAMRTERIAGSRRKRGKAA
jgi:hypothetical protein